ncbi:MAG: enoyl-CoA hydratase/isomerase family protein [Deltaproteobacteria bacterium]|nr:enoyl-CoA hydratase/isomerase family protein [Deltaproteobacteria bacterium]
MSDPIILQIDQHIATATFNRPDNLNAFDETMGKAFQKVCKEIDKNREIRVVVLTGAGRAFSSGGNLDMIESRTRKKEATNKKELKMFYRIFLGVRNIRVPVIAAVNGPAVGAGFCLALACDLRYASTEAKMGANFAKIGLAPGMGGTYLVTRLIGPTRAAEALLLAENLSAQRAFDMGLLNGIHEPDQLMPHVRGVAKVIAENGPIPVAMIKKGIQKALQGTLEQMFDYDSTCQAKTFATEDIKEGIRAIREKRSPVFKGT